MDLQTKLLLILLSLSTLQQNGCAHRSRRGLLDFRKMMKVFVRYNVKVNVVPYTSIFAFAMGFRGNWDIKPSIINNAMKRVSQQENSYQYPYYSQYRYQNPYLGQYSPYLGQYSQPQYQRAIHSTVKGAFDWHGLNGTACLQRTICEVSLINHDDVISQIFKVLFDGTEEISCPEELDCPFSFLDFVDHILSGMTKATSH